MQILAAVVLAGVTSLAWAWLADRLFWSSYLSYLVGWAVEGAVVALAARVAGGRRWAVGIPLLLVFVGGTAVAFTVFIRGLGGTGRYNPPDGIVPGVLLGLVVIGPAILVPSAKRAKPNAGAGSLRRIRRQGWDLNAVAMALGSLGVILAALLVTSSARERRVDEIGKDLRPAVEDLVRTDVLRDLGSVTWKGPWWSRDDVVARGEGQAADGTRVLIQWYGPLPLRRAGAPGRAEGLRTASLHLLVEVVQPRTLTDQEAGDLEFVKRALTNVGLRPELVAGLSPGWADISSRGMRNFTTNRNGLNYVITVNKPGRETLLYTVDRSIAACVSIYGGGVRSTGSVK